MNSRMKNVLFWCVLILLLLGFSELLFRAYYVQRNTTVGIALDYYLNAAVTRYFELTTRIGIFARDSTFGFLHKPNVQGRHRRLDFDVTYSIGPDGERRVPPPLKSRGRILFVGCSYTFGYGVNDDEAFPAVLARESWSEWTIVNKGAIAWGTAHAYLMVDQETRKTPRPMTVICTMIPHQIVRNYIRRSWVQELGRFDRDQPHFEIVDGKLVFQGVIGVEQSTEDSPEVRGTELELTKAFLVGMQKRCLEAGIPFFIVLLERGGWPPTIIRTLDENGIRYLDLSELDIQRFPHDYHPDESGHRQIACAIADSFIGSEIRSRGVQHHRDSAAVSP